MAGFSAQVVRPRVRERVAVIGAICPAVAAEVIPADVVTRAAIHCDPAVSASFGRVIRDRAVLRVEDQSNPEVLRVANSIATDGERAGRLDNNP